MYRRLNTSTLISTCELTAMLHLHSRALSTVLRLQKLFVKKFLQASQQFCNRVYFLNTYSKMHVFFFMSKEHLNNTLYVIYYHGVPRQWL